VKKSRHGQEIQQRDRDLGVGENEITEMKSSINQLKISMNNITNRLDQMKEIISGIEEKVEELFFFSGSSHLSLYD
jgi:chromosome segregation ATPase